MIVYTPGWYPDPVGRHEFRYHNGASWTGDVASGGQRYIDPLDGSSAAPAGSVSPEARSPAGNGMAVAALSCGVISVAIGWIPVVLVVGGLLAVLALVFGGIGLGRSRTVGRGRGFAIAGLVTGGVGLLAAGVGVVLTVLLWNAVERYENPVDHVASEPVCELVGNRVRGSGSIENLDDSTGSFTMIIDVTRAASGVPVTTVRVRIDDVAPGEIRPYDFSHRVTATDVDCQIVDVKGPLPLGVVVD